MMKDGDMLAGAVNLLLKDEKLRRAMATRNKRTVDGMRGALDATIKALDGFIHPLVLKARLESMPGVGARRGQ